MKFNALTLTLVLLAGAAPAAAAPTFFADTGHYYEYVGTGLSWTDARAAALASTFNGASGYLATVGSDAENAFLVSLAGDGWIGLTDQDEEGSFVWADGPEGGQAPTYTHWNAGEPNNAGNEDYVHLNNGNWNDLPNGAARGYFVEYADAAAAVPEPATWALTILGFGAVGGALRRNRKPAVRFA